MILTRGDSVNKIYEELEKLYSESDMMLIEALSLIWTKRCGYDLREEVYADLLEVSRGEA